MFRDLSFVFKKYGSCTFSRRSLKHFLYLTSMVILIFLTVLILVQAPFHLSHLDFLSSVTSMLPCIILSGSLCLICFFLLTEKILTKLSGKQQWILTLFLSALGIFLQYFILFYFRPVLRYDHLRVFDGALEILHTGNLSLSANDQYFGKYPFNISVTVFHSLILKIFQILRIPEKDFMLGLQCVYLALIDLGVFFSWKLLRILYSLKTASLFGILCFFNPILYVCAAGCYTTTLMVPLLMGTLLLFFLFLRETVFSKKCLWGFLSGAALAFGSRLRATVFIAGIALIIYLLIRQKPSETAIYSRKKNALLALLFLLGSLMSFGGFTLFQNTYISEDYRDVQMPPIYYLMFAANPDTRGTYNEQDCQMISSYTTLEEKEQVSLKVYKDRLKNMGLSGALSLGFHKLGLTWSDGTEDYRDFFITSRNYSKAHSFLAGDQKDFFALYCHIFHTAVLILFLISSISMMRRKCDSPYYLIPLTLLGGMIFHIFWESYDVYSFGFSMLLLIGAADGIQQRPLIFSNALHTTGTLSFLCMLLFLIPCLNQLRKLPYDHVYYRVVQDMCIGENQPLLSGECITQTFQTEHPFNEIACKVSNSKGTENQSLYRFELLSSGGDLLYQTDFYGSQIPDKNYCNFKMETVIPQGKETYTIRISPLYTSEEDFLTFCYYNTHHYDIYEDGSMTGLDSDSNADLTFQLYETVKTNFFH